MNVLAHVRRLLIAALLAACAGCATHAADNQPHPVWPAPPALPRIAHRAIYRSADDFGKPSFLDAIGSAITGSVQRPLINPSAVAVQGDRVAVSDQELQGVVLFEIGSNKTRLINHVGDQYFVSPVGVAWCDGRIALADSALNKVFLLSDKGKPITTFDKPGGWKRPSGLAWNNQSKVLYIVDTVAGDVSAFNLEGVLLRQFGSPGVDVGQFNFPTHIAIDQAGHLYVTDSLNFRVQSFDADGIYRFDVGQQGDATGHFGVPKGVAVDTFGHIYVVDSYFGVVQVFDNQGRFLLSFGGLGGQSGQLQVPGGIAIDQQNRIFICDSHNRRLQMYQYVGETP